MNEIDFIKQFCKTNGVCYKNDVIYLRPPTDDVWTPYIKITKYNKKKNKYYVICKRYCHWNSRDFNDWLAVEEIINIIKKVRGIKSYDIRANQSA